MRQALMIQHSTARFTRRWAALLLLAATSAASAAPAGSASPPIGRPESAPDPFVKPLTLADQPDSIYPDENESPLRPRSGSNEGGVHILLDVSYLTDYVYRGIDRGEVGAIDPSEVGSTTEDAPNLQFDGRLNFDTGRLPHPFVGAFVNVFNDDPVSRFQEVRPYAGLDWKLRPILLTAGWQTYIFPERDDFNTAEIFARIELDDGFLWRSDKPILSPYVYAAWDYDLYDGLYIEAGVKHDFAIEGTGITLTAIADVGFVASHGYFSAVGGGRSDDTGFQHYDIGLIGTYALNVPLNIPRRYGQWRLKGYLFYTDGIEKGLRADTQLWGGMGVQFEY